jgi:O-antigen ligase
MLNRCATWSYGAALVTLPLVGVGVLKLATGRDWGGGLQPSWLFMFLALLFLVIDKGRRRSLVTDFQAAVPRRLRPWWLGGLGAVILVLLLSLAGLWVAPAAETLPTALGRYGKQVIQLGIMFCFLVWPALWTRGRARWVWTVKLLVAGGLLQFGYGVLQGMNFYLGVPGFPWLDQVCTSNPSIFSGSGELYLGNAFRDVPRLRGTACEPLYLGNYLLLLLPLLLVVDWSRRRKILAGAALLLLLMATWSRGAWLGFLLQLLLAAVLLVVRRRPGAGPWWEWISRRRRWWLPGLAALLVVLPLVGTLTGWDGLLYPYRRLAQTFSAQDWSNLTRLYSMQAAWRAFLLSPLVGVGWGQFAWHFPLLVDPMGLQSQFTWPVVNNFPLQVLCETGLVGFTVFAGWTLGLVRGLFLRLNPGFGTTETPEGEWKRTVPLAVLLALVGVWFQLLTFSQFNLPHIWIPVGLALAAIAEIQPDRAESFPAAGGSS